MARGNNEGRDKVGFLKDDFFKPKHVGLISPVEADLFVELRVHDMDRLVNWLFLFIGDNILPVDPQFLPFGWIDAEVDFEFSFFEKEDACERRAFLDYHVSLSEHILRREVGEH